ncbi:hypothetical protein PHMEG_00019908 [Phytophthora megakarya]|uniref:Uncharacterized protein n=1 Tax=Phytophthora megakarya TaxID=4795 RepID=A0A225VQG7_9STRA|nr:hypothetical protein PHMEG_00019908 [Phytophthora megakarya]
MFVGRTVSGLPILQPEFAILPPRFTTSDEEAQRAKEICLPGLPQIAGFVAEFALASLIYHIDFLRQKLSSDHPLFQSPLFADAELIPQLRSRVQCDSNNDEMQPTGVPPHVKILSELQSVRSEVKEAVQLRKEDMKQLTEAQNVMYDRLISGVTTIIEERAIQTDVPTDAVEETVTAQYPVYPIYNWGGAMHFFPEGVKLPIGTPEQAWIHWCCGNSAQNLPPFRKMFPIDLGSGNLRKRLSDLKFLMSKIERAAKELNLSITDLSSSEAVTVFQQCKLRLNFLPRQRRTGNAVADNIRCNNPAAKET